MTTELRLNTLAPGPGHKHAPRRVGRGIGSGLGKTSGRGHKGLKARSGGSVRPGFEGGQMPLQRRVPKRGFRSRSERFGDEVRLDALQRLDVDLIDLNVLKKADLVSARANRVKIIASGKLEKAVKVSGVRVTRGARKAIEGAGGSIEGA